MIASIGVDSGHVLIVDPCYMLEGERYEALCTLAAQQQQGSGEVVLASPSGGLGNGVLARTAYGDGEYKVIAHRDQYGRNIALTVVFDQERCVESGLVDEALLHEDAATY